MVFDNNIYEVMYICLKTIFKKVFYIHMYVPLLHHKIIFFLICRIKTFKCYNILGLLKLVLT